MSTTTEHPRTAVTDYSAPRSQDWSAYRERALVEGQRFLTAVDASWTWCAQGVRCPRSRAEFRIVRSKP